MMTNLNHILRRMWRDRRGTIFVMAAAATAMILGFAAVIVDLGHAYVIERQLQSAADAAALAGATNLYDGGTYVDAETAAKSWSASSGEKNALSNVTVTTTVSTMECTGGKGTTCTATTSNPNALMVTEAGSVPTYFGRVIGVDTLNVSATSYAIGLTNSCTSNCSGTVQEADVMILVDTTQSMQDAASSASDPACAGLTNVQCAMVGVQALLKDLTPPTNGVGGATVGLMTFPGLLTAADAAKEYCSGGSPSKSNIAQYNASTSSPFYNAPYYLIYPTYSSLTAGGGLDGNYATRQGTLNTSDNLVIAAYGDTSCNGLTAYGGAGTSLAIAMQEAATILKNDGRSGAHKYLVILSDGDANTLAKMPSGFSITDPTTNMTYTGGNDECHQAIAASRIAQNDGITVVILGYGEETTNANGNPAGCDSDTGSANLISPCTTMTEMASVGTGSSTSPQFFYSDAAASGPNACPSPANPSFTSVNEIFAAIANSVSGGNGATANLGSLPHLIPAS